MKTYLERIKENIKVTIEGCWEWQRYRLPYGYGRTRYLGKNVTVHRLSWILHRGEIPASLCVCHKCDNAPCCNPDHLFLGTHTDNMRDAVLKGRKHGWPIHAITKQRVRKLTHDQVDEIKSSSETGASLARRFGCSESNVSMIRRGKRKTAPRR